MNYTEKIEYYDSILELIKIRNETIKALNLEHSAEELKVIFDTCEYQGKIISQLIKGTLQ